MTSAYEVMCSGGLAVLEAPTGSGKSLSLLCSAISWLRDWRTRVLANNLEGAEIAGEEGSIPDWVRDKTSANALVEAEKMVEEWRHQRMTLRADADKIGISSCTSSNSSRSQKRKVYVEAQNESDGDLLSDAPLKNKGQEAPPEASFRPRVFICSRTHSQISQLVREIRRVESVEQFTVVSVGSRAQLCVHPNMSLEAGVLGINEFCNQLVENQSCEFRNNLQDLRTVIAASPLDVDEMRRKGSDSRFMGCPYFASRSVARDADIILAPYASIFHRESRESLGLDIQGSIVIVDEAHNVLDAVNSIRSVSLTDSDLSGLVVSLSKYMEKYIQKLAPRNLVYLRQVFFLCRRLLKYVQESDITKTMQVSDLTKGHVCDGINIPALISFVEESRLAHKLRGFCLSHALPGPSAIYDFQSFLNLLVTAVRSDRIIIELTGSSPKSLKFMGVDAESEFSKFVALTRAVILVGGTMQPFREFEAIAKRSDVPFTSYIGSQVIPQRNLLCLSRSKSRDGDKLLFSAGYRSAHIESIAETVLLCSRYKGGTIVFVSAYGFVNQISSALASAVEPEGVPLVADNGTKPVDSIIHKFRHEIGQRGRCVLLSVMGGRLSEGIDFRDNLCRSLIVVGLPYPNIRDPVLRCRMEYYDEMHRDDVFFPTGEELYESRCIKAINQTIGRAVRHKSDWAAIILLDARFQNEAIRNSLSTLVKSSLKDVSSEELSRELEDFFHRLEP
jgi:chromosome transmission fidelity protein 1